MIWGQGSAIGIIAASTNTAPPAAPTSALPFPQHQFIFSPLSIVAVGGAAKVAQALIRNPILSRRRALFARWGWTDDDKC